MTYLLLTAITVSIDSFVCGFSLVLGKGKKWIIVSTIALTVLLMCLATNYLAILLAQYLNEQTASLGGLLLIGVGIYNLFKKDKKQVSSKSTFRQSLVTGFAVGLDGAFANLSLSLMGINQFYVPFVIAICHAVTIWLGILLSETPFAKRFERFGFIAPVILILLGVYKLTGLII